MQENNVTVLGAGAWGTALAILLNRAGAHVTLWMRSETMAESIRTSRTNQRYLPDLFIDPSIEITTDLHQAVKADALVLAIPAQAMRMMCINLSDMIDTNIPLIVTAKGIERGSLLLMSEVMDATLPSNPLVLLSGPNFAREAAEGRPTATVLAARDTALLEQVQFLFAGHYFRPYLSNDMISVQIGGAIKNVVALACGMALGSGLGENTRAAVMTRGLAEMTRLAEVKGGNPLTMLGLSGLGDLTLSCCSEQSRNMRYGKMLGEVSMQEQPEQPITTPGLTEGVLTAEAVYELSLKLGVSMPISVTVAEILKNKMTVSEGIESLLSRPFHYE